MTLYAELVTKYDLQGGRSWPEIEPNYAMVAIGRGAPEVFPPMKAPGFGQRRFGGFVAVYRVKTVEFSVAFEERLPTRDFGYSFDLSLRLTLKINKPAEFIRSAPQDLEGALKSDLIDLFRPIALRRGRAEDRQAEHDMREVLRDNPPSYGLELVRFTVGLSPDKASQTLASQLRAVDEESQVTRVKQLAEHAKKDLDREWAKRQIAGKTPVELLENLMAMKLAGETGAVDEIIGLLEKRHARHAQIMHDLLQKTDIEPWRATKILEKYLEGASQKALPAASLEDPSDSAIVDSEVAAKPDEDSDW